jgi:drug/metabolite transporter (DMT)-like permease
MTHRRALWLMVLVTLLWSTAGVVSRQLESARGFEVTFWRSAFTLLTLLAWWGLREGRTGLAPLLSRSPLLWASGACWAVMFTAFMLALTMTTVANVLVVMSLGPLFTALLAWAVLGQRLAPRTLFAVLLAGAGVAWMFSAEGLELGWGPLVALAVPVAAACNFILLQEQQAQRIRVSFPHAVALGALLSSLLTLPMAWPFQASSHDLAWLAFLGATQLALPCVMLVHLSRVLSATEVSLLALLELIFGATWAWWLAGEVLSPRTLSGAALVLAALVLNELRRRPTPVALQSANP